MSSSVIQSLRASNQCKLDGVLPRADRPLAFLWWTILFLRGLLPAFFALAMGALVGAVQTRAGLVMPLVVFGIVFVLLQVLPPVHRAVGAN